MQLSLVASRCTAHGWHSYVFQFVFALCVVWVGTVHSRNLSATDLKKTPTATFAVKYTSKMAGNAINGNVACELSARTHGPAEWWVLVEKEAADATSIAAGKAKGKGKAK